MSDRRVTVEYVVDAKGAVKGIRTVNGEQIKFQREAKKSSKSAKLLGNSMSVALGTLLVNAATKAAQSLNRLARFGWRQIIDSIKSRQVQQIAERKLEQALRGLGTGAEDSLPGLKKLASQIQSTSNFGDEAILTAQSLIVRMAGTESAAFRLSQGMVDLAAATASTTGQSVDLVSISRALGTAVSGNVGLLTRYGIKLSDAEQAAFKLADTEERVLMLEKILSERFGGAAEAAIDPFTQLNNAVGDLKEDIGEALLPVVEDLALWLKDLAEDPEIKELAFSLGQDLAGSVMSVGDAVRENWREFLQLLEWIQTVGDLWKFVTTLQGGDTLLQSLFPEIFADDTRGLDAIERFNIEFAKAHDKVVSGRPTPDAPEDEDVELGFSDVISRRLEGEDLIADEEQTTEAVERAVARRVQAFMAERAARMQLSVEGKRMQKLAAEAVGEDAEHARQRAGSTKLVIAAIEARQEAERRHLEQFIQSSFAQAQNAADVANSVIASIRQVIQGYLAQTIAKNLASLPPGAALIVGGAVAAGIGALFSRLLPKFSSTSSTVSGGQSFTSVSQSQSVVTPDFTRPGAYSAAGSTDGRRSIEIVPGDVRIKGEDLHISLSRFTDRKLATRG